MPTTQETSRYSTPRLLINWRANATLRSLKMLAWKIWRDEHPDINQLWKRVEELCPQVIESVTGESGVTLQRIIEETAASQRGATITPHKLMQRADKTDRNVEFEPEVDAVIAAYKASRRGPGQVAAS